METNTQKQIPKKLEIDYKGLAFFLLYRLWIVIIVAGIFAGGFYVYSRLTSVPVYTATVKLFVYNHGSDELENIDTAKYDSAGASAAQSLMPVYIQILKSNRVCEQIAIAYNKKYNTNYTYGQIKSLISATPISGTPMLNISITSTNSEEAINLVNFVANFAPREIEDVVEGTSAKEIDFADVAAYTTVYNKYIVMGFGIGAGISLVFFILMFLLNTKISTEEDIVKYYNAPVLGKIPSFTAKPKSNKYYEYRMRVTEITDKERKEKQ